MSKYTTKSYKNNNIKRKSLLNLVFLLIISFHSISNQCDEFCLKCSSLDKCELCDFTANKTLNANKCEDNSISNCLISLNSGVCDKCASGYKFDSNKKECVNGDIENCLYYDSSGKCSNCSEGTYLEDNTCVKNQNIIPNCLKFQEIPSSDGENDTSKTFILIILN
jgi:hypothetical protein